jgi:molecular chaperone HscB
MVNDYFALFGLPVKFETDMAELRKVFFEESRKYHPDFFANHSEEERNAALAKSIIINNAFKTLSNESSRVKYILEMKGILQEKEKETLPPEFLMEMMEINEALMEGDNSGIRAVEAQVNEMQERIAAGIQTSGKEFDQTGSMEALKQIKENWLKQKYLARLRESISEKL